MKNCKLTTIKKALLYFTLILLSTINLHALSYSAVVLVEDRFTGGNLYGWGGSAYTYQSGWMYIDGRKSADKTYDFSSTYANKTIEIEFAWYPGSWDKNKDKLEIYQDNTKIKTYYNDKSYRIEKFQTKLDANGKINLKFKANTDKTKRWIAIQYVKISTPNPLLTCPGLLEFALDGTTTTKLHQWLGNALPAWQSHFYHFRPNADGKFKVEYISDYSNRAVTVRIYDVCGNVLVEDTGFGSRTLYLNNVKAGQQIIVEAYRRYNSPADYDLSLTYTVLLPTPPHVAVIPDQNVKLGNSLSVNVANYTTEINGDPITYSATGLPSGMSINASTGNITGSPTTSGTFNVTATATDKDGSGSSSFVINVTIPPIVANADSFTTQPYKSISDNFMANDSGYNIQATAITQPSNGSVTYQADGSFVYTPTAGFAGLDSFTYTIKDALGSTATTTVSINVVINTVYRSGIQPFTLINPPQTRNIVGGYKIAGNTVMCLTEKTSGYGGTCHGQTDYQLETSNRKVSKYIDIDTDSSTWNSTSSYINLPTSYNQRGGKGIVWAGLFWQGRISNASSYNMHYGVDNNTNYTLTETGKGASYKSIDLSTIGANKLRLKVDTSVYKPVTATTLYSLGDGYAQTYAAYADVTNILQTANLNPGKHTFTVANLVTNEGRESSPGVFGGWSLVVIYLEDALNGSPRNISIYNGFDSLNTRNAPIPITGFRLPSGTSTFHAKLSLFSGEGEYRYGRNSLSQWASDTIQLSDQQSSNYSDMPGSSSPLNIFDGVLDGVLRDDIPGKSNNLQVNNDGIDVDDFDVSSLMTSYRNANPLIQTVYIKYYSNNDYVTPSMIAFTTELYKPRICYDYTLDIGGYVLDSTNNKIQTPFGGYGNTPLTTRVTIQSQEGDYPLTDVNVTYKIADTRQLQYIKDSTAITPTGIHTYIPAGPNGLNQTYGETNSGFGMYIGVGAKQVPNGPGGVIGPFQTRYFKFDNKMSVSNLNTWFDMWLEYTVNYGSGPLTLTKNLDASSMCTSAGGYYPAYGIFNVSSENASTSSANFGQPYNLYTQIAKRNFNARIFSYNTDYKTPKVVNTSVEAELFNAGHFNRDTNISCFNPDSNITQPIFVRFNNQSSASINNLSYDGAIRNTGFRVWHITRPDGTLVQHTCTNRADEACFQKLYTVDYSSDTFCKTQCSKTGSGCYACLRKFYGKPTCSRDNFSVRPEAFVTNLSDSNQDASTSAIAKDIANSKVSTNLPNKANISAGYNYRFDINGTNFNDDTNTRGYNQQFDAVKDGSSANMTWSPGTKDVTGCNDTSDKTISITLYNGESVNHYTNKTSLSNIKQVGRYSFSINDINWTSVDWYPNYTKHHNASGFLSTEDCQLNSSIVNPVGSTIRNGCSISSIHTHPNGSQYTALDLTVFPYSFNLSLNASASPSGNKDFVYINTLSNNLYPDGIDENMSYNITGTFRAQGYNAEVLSNYVDKCYAEDTDMTLRYTYLSSVPSLTPNFTYDLIDYNTTNPSDIIRPRSQNRFTNTQSKNIENNVSITQNSIYYEKSMNGAITMELGLNFDRENNKPLNPRFIYFNDLNISQKSNISVDRIDTYKAFGVLPIDSNISFLYGRVKTTKLFYGDITTSSISTPLSIVVYCDLGYTECQNRGIFAKDAQTNEFDWWKSWQHNNQIDKDGNVELVSTPSTALSSTSASITSKGEDTTISVSKGSLTLPATIPVNLVVNDPKTPAPSKYTDRWLIYNPSDPILPPSPFFSVGFIGTGAWAGQGQTGNVVGGTSSSKKNGRLEW